METCTKQDSRDYSHQSEPQKGQKQVFSKVNTENRKVSSQPADAHMYLFPQSSMHMCTKCLNRAAWKPTPATGSQDCRCPLPSVIKSKASNWNHSILLLRQHSAVQRREPIINPQDDPALKSFPSRPDQRPPSATYFWIHVCFPVAAGKNRVTQGLKQECSLNVQ